MEAIEKQIAKVIAPSEWHRTIIGVELVKAREARGLTQYQFAIECGWSTSWQCQIEAPGKHEVHIETAEKIVEVLLKLSIIKIKI